MHIKRTTNRIERNGYQNKWNPHLQLHKEKESDRQTDRQTKKDTLEHNIITLISLLNLPRGGRPVSEVGYLVFQNQT